MNSIIDLTKDYIETLLSVHASIVQNNVESTKALCDTIAPPMAGTSYNGETLLTYFNKLEEQIIYDVEDCFFLHWIVIKLPQNPDTNKDFLVIGPFFTSAQTASQMDLLTQRALLRNRIQVSFTTPLKMFYNSVPVCSLTKVITLARILITHLYDTEREPLCKTVYPFGLDRKVDPQDYYVEEEHVYMAQTERRYSLESKLQADVTQGASVGALQTWRILRVEMENLRRLKDPLRNAKNNGIVLNTILRKAVARSYVHPLYIDSLSNQILSAIENTNSVEELHRMQEDSILEYCKLVTKHSLIKYTPMVRQALNYINTHLSSDIHLPEIASAINVSPNYLSAVFNREAEMSISTYINRRRIEKAVELLETSNANIEDIASFVGFSDMNYFTRVFKGIKGITPSEYRKHGIITDVSSGKKR
ncbi:MAG: AraC family transcriptional regulator [Treponemataceae bacterium]|nr:AraC family transcriptional regulator [Treponemataceae bacterium]